MASIKSGQEKFASPLDLSSANELKEGKRKEEKMQNSSKSKRRKFEEELEEDTKEKVIKESQESVTLFPGLTITSGESTSKTGLQKTSFMTPSPSPPEEAFVPRFNFGGSGGRSEDEKEKSGDPLNASIGFDSWWHPNELSDLTIPFHGLPAFRKYIYLYFSLQCSCTNSASWEALRLPLALYLIKLICTDSLEATLRRSHFTVSCYASKENAIIQMTMKNKIEIIYRLTTKNSLKNTAL